jgi:uncharacterized protein (TIGR03382 family)
MVAYRSTMDTSRPLRFALPMLVVIGIGVGLRLLGYFDPALQLWLDEASWAEMLVDGSATWIRPAGYMKLSGWLISIVNIEPMLRSLSLLGGVALLLFAQGIFRRVSTSNAVAVFGVFLLAISPVAVGMSKEFKPYAVEAAFHGAMIWLVVRWLADHRLHHIVGFVVVAALAPLFAWSVVFAYPGLFLIVAVEAARTRRLRELGLCGVGGVTTLVVLVFIFLQRVAGEDEKTGFWGRKYDVFYTGRRLLDGAWWGVKKTFEVAGFPGHLSLGWPPTMTQALEAGLPAVMAVAVLVSLVVLLARRRWLALTIWALPWVMALVFNAAGKWPYGVFRTNLFLLVYSVGVLVAGLDALISLRSWSPATKRLAVFGLVLVSGAMAPLDLDRFRIKEENSLALSSSVRTALEHVVAEAPADGPVDFAMDGHSCGASGYYRRLHRDTKDVLGPALSPSSSRFRIHCGGFVPKKWLVQLDQIHSPVSYVMVAKPSFVALTREQMRLRCSDFTEVNLPSYTTVFRCVPRDAPTPSTTPVPDDVDEHEDAGENGVKP